MTYYTKLPNGRYKMVEEMPEDDTAVIELTDRQCVTVAGALGITLINILSKNVKTPIIANRIRSVEKEIQRMFKDTGSPVDEDIATHFCKAWDATIRSMNA